MERRRREMVSLYVSTLCLCSCSSSFVMFFNFLCIYFLLQFFVFCFVFFAFFWFGIH